MSRRRSPREPSTPSDSTTPSVHVLSLRKKIAFSFVSVVAVFAFVELALRLARVGEPPTVGVMRFGYDTGIPIFDSDGIEYEGEPFRDVPLFEADLTLFWKPIANTPFTGTEGLRLPTPESKQKGADVYRIAIVGDSCSFLGEDLYPNRFARLAEQETGRKIEVVNASCPGYTSLQGRRRLRNVWPWQPDLIVVYCGWNDHWKSLNGQTDRDLVERQLLSDNAKSWMGKSRLVWSLYSLRIKLTPPVPIHRSPVRVPPEDYRANLQQILGEVEQQGCKVVFVTAPSAFLDGQMPPWAFSFFGQIYQMSPNDVAGIPQTHERYNDIVREVAGSSSSAFLLDVAGEWSEPSQVERHIELFRGDRIHLQETGHQEIAEQLFELWKEIP
ncbi:MAG: SGNH/GDSL hydrolase family protein [Rubripirellula sp.]